MSPFTLELGLGAVMLSVFAATLAARGTDRRWIAWLATLGVLAIGIVGIVWIGIDARLVQLFFKTNHSLFESSQPFRLMSLKNRVSLDETLLETQLVFQAIAVAVLRFG